MKRSLSHFVFVWIPITTSSRIIDYVVASFFHLSNSISLQAIRSIVAQVGGTLQWTPGLETISLPKQHYRRCDP